MANIIPGYVEAVGSKNSDVNCLLFDFHASFWHIFFRFTELPLWKILILLWNPKKKERHALFRPSTNLQTCLRLRASEEVFGVHEQWCSAAREPQCTELFALGLIPQCDYHSASLPALSKTNCISRSFSPGGFTFTLKTIHRLLPSWGGVQPLPKSPKRYSLRQWPQQTKARAFRRGQCGRAPGGQRWQRWAGT